MTLLIYVLEDNLLSSSDWTIIANACKQTLTTKCSKQNVVIHCLYMIINVTEEECKVWYNRRCAHIDRFIWYATMLPAMSNA